MYFTGDGKKLEELVCPSCGATLPWPDHSGHAECKFCQLKVIIHQPTDALPRLYANFGTAEAYFPGGTLMWMPGITRGT